MSSLNMFVQAMCSLVIALDRYMFVILVTRIAGIGNPHPADKGYIRNSGKHYGVDLYIVRQVVDTVDVQVEPLWTDQAGD